MNKLLFLLFALLTISFAQRLPTLPKNIPKTNQFTPVASKVDPSKLINNVDAICKQDIIKFCPKLSSTKPSEALLFKAKCMVDNRDNLSPTCRRIFEGFWNRVGANNDATATATSGSDEVEEPVFITISAVTVDAMSKPHGRHGGKHGRHHHSSSSSTVPLAVYAVLSIIIPICAAIIFCLYLTRCCTGQVREPEYCENEYAHPMQMLGEIALNEKPKHSKTTTTTHQQQQYVSVPIVMDNSMPMQQMPNQPMFIDTTATIPNLYPQTPQ